MSDIKVTFGEEIISLTLDPDAAEAGRQASIAKDNADRAVAAEAAIGDGVARAETAADEAQASLAAFNTRYLEAQASDPVGTFPAGTLYFNTTVSRLKVFDANANSWLAIGDAATPTPTPAPSPSPSFEEGPESITIRNLPPPGAGTLTVGHDSIVYLEAA